MLPFNFSVSNAFDSLSFVFRVISDVSPMPFANLITRKVYESSRFIFSDELDHAKSSVYEYTNVDGKKKKNQTSASRSLIDLIGTDKELLERGNTLFRKCSILFGYIGLLSTVFANAILTNSKNAIKFVEWAVEANEEWGNLIVLLGDIHR